jgi:hypothetical protein
MKKRIGSVVFVFVMVAALASAQDAMKKNAPPKPAVRPSQALLENWKLCRRETDRDGRGFSRG